MTPKKLFTLLIVGLLTFMLGWFLRGSIKEPKDSQHLNALDAIANADTFKIKKVDDYSNTIAGHFVVTESHCAGFTFVDKNMVLWTNEIACDYPDTLKIKWLDNSTFMTRTTERTNEHCPPKVDIYKIVSFDGKRLVLKSFWTGWNDLKDENLEFDKQAQ